MKINIKKELDKAYPPKVMFVYDKLAQVENLITSNLCQHYHDIRPCQRCDIECPYDIALNALRQARMKYDSK